MFNQRTPFIIITILVLLACRNIPGIEVVDRPSTEIIPPNPEVVSTVAPGAAVVGIQSAVQVVTVTVEVQAPTPVPGPPPEPDPTFVERATGFFSPTSYQVAAGARPLHGVVIAIFLPLFCLVFPWIFLELAIVRYVQPRGVDITTIQVKAQDGLFINAVVSITARREISLASLQTDWRLVTELVSKSAEEELGSRALDYESLDDLRVNLGDVSETLLDLPIVGKVSRDYGIKVMRFNIEVRYPQETVDALNRQAEATAGGQAYKAYARAAGLDHDSPDTRQLFIVYQQTRGQVDAARNLGSGITSLAELITQRVELPANKNEDSES